MEISVERLVYTDFIGIEAICGVCPSVADLLV